jgi:hypothetical protein
MSTRTTGKKTNAQSATAGITNVVSANPSMVPVGKSSILKLQTLPTGIGFGPNDLADFVTLDPATGKIYQRLGYHYEDAVTDVILQQNMLGTSTITIQLTDPSRQILRGTGLGSNQGTGGYLSFAEVADSAAGGGGQGIKQGLTIIVAGQVNNRTIPYIDSSPLAPASNYIIDPKTKKVIQSANKLVYTLVQFVKASDQVQLVFESEAVFRLSQQRGNGSVTSQTNAGVTPFVKSLVEALNPPPANSYYSNITLFAPDYAQIWNALTGNQGVPVITVALGRGTTTDPYEDSWTAISRIASSIGWRVWENANTVYFGPDEFWLGILPGQNNTPPINAIKGTTGDNMQIISEFNDKIQLIDFDWDVGKPLGQATVTCMLDDWQFDIGEIIKVTGCGIADGQWMISSMQRDAFRPQATVVLQVPMPYGQVYDPTSQPLSPFPIGTSYGADAWSAIASANNPIATT